MRNVLIIMALLGLVLTSCSIRQPARTAPEEEIPENRLLYDPLVTPADREVVPEVYPVTIAMAPESGDSLVAPRDIAYDIFDSSAANLNPREVYRIQIYTSRLYNEASRELALAEEIFNLPVHLDYEVPYYKLRVGDFAVRSEAEDMLPEIRAIGYRDAWVARVIIKVRELPPFETYGEPIMPLDSSVFSPVRPDSTKADEQENNR